MLTHYSEEQKKFDHAVIFACDQIAYPGKNRIPSRNYNPTILFLTRFLYNCPGKSATQVSQINDLGLKLVQAKLKRMDDLKIAEQRMGRGGPWYLTAIGQRIREIIDQAGID